MSASVAVQKADVRFGAVLKRILRSPVTILLVIALGVVCGLYAPAVAHALAPVAYAYLNLLKMVVLPLLIASVIFSISLMMQDPQTVKYLGRVAVAVLVISFIAVVVAGTLSLILQPGNIVDPQSRIELGKFINSQGTVSTDLELALTPPTDLAPPKGLLSIVLNLIPNNVFGSLASGNTIQVLLFCLLFGLAIGRVPKHTTTSFAQGLDAVYRACLILTGWFIWALPFATFILIADQTASIGPQPIMLMAGFLLVMGIAAAIFMVAASVIVSVQSGRRFWTTVKAFQPLVMVAITTRSSVASIPWIVELLVERLKFDKVTVELLAPLQIALLRTGPTLLYVSGTIFIAQLYGRSLSGGDLALIGVASALLALTTAGMAGLVITSQISVLCGYLNLPFEAAFVLFVAVDTVTDMFMTLATVSMVTASTATIAPQGAEEATPQEDAISEESLVAVGGRP